MARGGDPEIPSALQVHGETVPLARGIDLSGIHEEVVRRAFVSKVYGIVSAQLLVTAVVAWAISVSAEEVIRGHPGILLVGVLLSAVTAVVILCVFDCCPDTTRSSPGNYLLLGLFTLAESVLVGFTCAGYTTESVLVVLAIAAFVFSALTAVASLTTVDVTGAGPYLLCCLLALLGFGLCMVLASVAALGSSPGEYATLSPAFETARIFHATLGALLFSVYIVYDTQLILGGKHHQHEFSYDDYVVAAIALYVDLVQLFMYLLRLFGERH